MKQMSFPRSCAYTAVANLLEHDAVDTTDRETALEIGLPYQFRLEEDTYLTGTMLQSAEWFDRFLMPRGFRLAEETVSRAGLISYLTQRRRPCMLGVELECGRHAVNFQHVDGGKLVFANNRHPDSDEPDWFIFTPAELLERVEDEVVVGTLEACPICQPDTTGDRDKTEAAFASYRETVAQVWTRPATQRQLLSMLNPVFAPLFLDAPIMMELIGENTISQSMISMRTAFLTALRQAETLELSDVISMEVLNELLDCYQEILLSH